jgi:hypothetical protein
MTRSGLCAFSSLSTLAAVVRSCIPGSTNCKENKVGSLYVTVSSTTDYYSSAVLTYVRSCTASLLSREAARTTAPREQAYCLNSTTCLLRRAHDLNTKDLTQCYTRTASRCPSISHHRQRDQWTPPDC